MSGGADRWCALGNHHRPESDFDRGYLGRLMRDCRRCHASRKAPMLGVDIDAIHWKLGKVRKGAVRR